MENDLKKFVANFLIFLVFQQIFLFLFFEKKNEIVSLKNIYIMYFTIYKLFCWHLKKNNIFPSEYNHWIVDLQGSELLVFKGAEGALKSCNSISVEVSKVKYYEGGVLWNELVNWLNKKNFYSISKKNTWHLPYFFILFI